jgi:hypothetical protein
MISLIYYLLTPESDRRGIGSSYDETDSRKATYEMAGRNIKSPDRARESSIPPHSITDSGMSKGFWRLNWIHLREQTINLEERIKTVC